MGKTLRLLAAAGLFICGGFIAYLGNEQGNPLVIFVGFCGLAGGFILVVKWRQQGNPRLIGPDGKGRRNGQKANSLNIYCDHIEFAYVEKPVGQPQRGLNDGKYYNIHKTIIEGESEEFKLPDDDDKERYYDPSEFANPVTMPSNKKYFTWSASLMQKISIGLMAAVIGGELIGLVAMGG